MVVDGSECAGALASLAAATILEAAPAACKGVATRGRETPRPPAQAPALCFIDTVGN